MDCRVMVSAPITFLIVFDFTDIVEIYVRSIFVIGSLVEKSIIRYSSQSGGIAGNLFKLYPIEYTLF